MKLEMRNLRIGTRLGLALALPIVMLFLLSLWIITGYYQTSRDMGKLRKMAELAPIVSALTNELQKERSILAASIGVNENTHTEKLASQQRETNVRLAEFDNFLESFNTTRLGKNLAARIAAAQKVLGNIESWRKSSTEQAADRDGIALQYSNAIAKLLEVTGEMPLVSTDTNLARTINAYNHLVRNKEYASMERTVGSAGFASGWLDPADLKTFIELIGQQQLLLNEFRSYATPDQASLLDRMLSSPDVAEVERIRQFVIEYPYTGSLGGITVSHWFDTMTRKINWLSGLENRVASDLIKQATSAENSAASAVTLISMAVLFLLVLILLLAAAIARGILLPLERVTNTISSLAVMGDASDLKSGMEESTRADEIGSLARAALVFRENLLKVVQAEETIKSEAILRMHHHAMGSISQGVLITDAQRRITYVNAAFRQITGYSEQEVMGLEPTFMQGAETDPEILGKLRSALLRGEAFTCTLMNYRKDGTPFLNELSITPVFDEQNTLTQFVGVMRNVTEERLLEQEIRIAATAFESLHGIMVTDANGLIVRVNKAFTEITGYSAEEVIGRKPSLLMSRRHSREFYNDMWKQLVTTGGWSGEIWDRRKNGEIFPKWQTISAVRGPDGHVTHYVATFFDTTERKKAEEQIRNLAFYDPLTGLPNRRLLMDRLQQAMATSARSKRHGALLFIDLDQFKTLNDTMGHDMGDLLLQQVSSRLTGCVRDGDTVARLGGDEFVVMLENLSESPEEAAARAKIVGENILSTLNQVYLLAGHEHHNTPSIGVALYCGHEISLDELLKRADLAMYQSKAAGRNAMRFFDPQMQSIISNRVALEKEIRQGLQRNEFLLYYQAQVCQEDCVVGAEVLVRWLHPKRGMVYPAEFISLSEETGLILPMGQWVLETACKQLAIWAMQPATCNLTLSVNVSARQFHHPDFVGQVLSVLEKTGANPERLKLELTEGMLLDNVEDIIDKMNALKTHGISFSLDDFGTGYSSLAYLKRLPLYQLKIDQSFVRDVLTDQNDAAIAQTIVTLAKNMGLSVIAEGVETEEQRMLLKEHGCRAFQGYMFSKPVPIHEFEQMIEQHVRFHPNNGICQCL